MHLSDCLALANWRTLAAIAQTHRLAIGPHPTRPELLAALSTELPRRVASLHRAGLPQVAAEALAALAVADASASLPDFVAVYGSLRGLTGVKDEDPRRLARQPQSITEWLIFHGLAFVVPASERGQSPLIVLPDEWLAEFRPEPSKVSIDLPGEPVQWPEPSLALAVYLATLRATPSPLLKSMRLPATTLQSLASLLGQPTNASAADWLGLARFVAFLAWRLGLTLPQGGRLHPSPLAATWLDQPLAARRADLWRAWLDETDLPTAWRRHRLPAGTLRDPAAFTHRLLDRLRTVEAPSDTRPRPWRALDDLVPIGDPGRLIADLVPWWAIENHPDLGRDLARGMLRGPLAWLEAVEWDDTPTPRWRLTDLGAWYLGLRGAPPPASFSLHLSVTFDDDGVDNPPLTVAPGPPLISLADWADLRHDPPDEPWPPRLSLTRTSVTRGLRRGGRIEDLLRLLTTTARPAPSDALQSTLRAWATPHAVLRLRQALVLGAPNEAHLEGLLRYCTVRRSVIRRLSSTDIEVEPASLPNVKSTLERLGHSLAVSAPDITTGPPPDRHRLSLDVAELAWLLTALEGYAELARRLGLPPPPAALADRVAAHLDPLAQASAQRAAEHATEHLDRTLRDLDPALAPVPADTLLAFLETAIQDNADIHMRYWTPGRPAPLSRIVSPRRIEWHGDTPYLVAYCHLRRDERTFRLDRVLAVGPIQS